jgi:sn-glycerol 3-phosphate transport system permease protein
VIERTPFLNIATHAILVFGLLFLLLPMYLVIVAASHSLQAIQRSSPLG